MLRHNLFWAFLAVAVAMPSAFCADWNPRLAANYLDSRQQEWFAWKAANNAVGGPCISCHTSMTYLLARPALRRSLGEQQATRYELGLLDAMRARFGKKEAAEMFPGAKGRHAAEAAGVEAVLSTLFLAGSGEQQALSAEARQAFERLWSLQLKEGKNKGAWAWNEFGLDPWEVPDSVFYGAALAALAAGHAPAAYRNEPEVRERVAELTAYLQREQQNQPLHNRLLLLWAAAEFPGLLPDSARITLVDEIQLKQAADGGWTLKALGPFGKHPHAPPAEGSNSYATGLAAFVLQKAGVPRSEAGMVRALAWLQAHQDAKSGAWLADSMNKSYADPMPARFMRDAATAFAVLALLDGDATRGR